MQLDITGDNDYDDADEWDDTRAYNTANELLTRDTDSDTNIDHTLAHDAVGNMTDDGEANEFVYDVWGRLRKVNNQTPDLVSEYRYNGLNQRISWHYDTDGDMDVDGNDKTYYFAYDERWRPVATFRADDADPKEQFVYHAAGNDGRGSSSYIDDVILRDKDADTDWDVQADGTLEERIYYCQNWRHDVVALIDANGGGEQLEHVRYEAYGVPFLILAGDMNYDGQLTIADLTAIQNIIDSAGYDIRADVDLDGDVDSTDKGMVTGGKNGGRELLSYVGNRKGYAGYEFDDQIDHVSYHVRHRVLNSTLGQSNSRNGTNDYQTINPITIPEIIPPDPGECQSLLSPCYDDPRVKAALTAINARCYGLGENPYNTPMPLGTLHCEDCPPNSSPSGWTDYECPGFGGDRGIDVHICKNATDPCATLAHELMHVSHLCAYGLFATSCSRFKSLVRNPYHRMCAEFEAPLVAGQCHSVEECCDMACRSVGDRWKNSCMSCQDCCKESVTSGGCCLGGFNACEARGENPCRRR